LVIIIIKENRDRGEFGGKLLRKVFVGCEYNN